MVNIKTSVEASFRIADPGIVMNTVGGEGTRFAVTTQSKEECISRFERFIEEFTEQVDELRRT